MSKVEDIGNFAANCSLLTVIPSYNWSSVKLAIGAFKNCKELVLFPSINMPEVTTINSMFEGCLKLNNFPAIKLPKCTSLSGTWAKCSAMETFGLIVLGAADRLDGAWSNCSSLKTFPLINTSTVTNFYSAWFNCSALTQFPTLNMSNATNVSQAWKDCSSLTTFPHIIFPATIQVPNSAAITPYMGFGGAWGGCRKLQSFPTNCFRNVQTGTFSNAFFTTVLDTQSKANIMQDLDMSGVTGASPPEGPYSGSITASTLTIAGGAPIAAGDPADVQKQKLVAKGWDVTGVI